MLRTLKLEQWFNDAYTERGLWVGGEFDKQGLLKCEPVKDADKKFNFPGLAFRIENSEYTVIKTM